MKMKWYEWILISLLYVSTIAGMVIVFSLMNEAMAAEKGKLPLSSGYIDVKAPTKAVQRPKVSRGYITMHEGGYAASVRLRTYERGNTVITTGRIGNRHIRVETPKED